MRKGLRDSGFSIQTADNNNLGPRTFRMYVRTLRLQIVPWTTRFHVVIAACMAEL
jgi:hypothetical protein